MNQILLIIFLLNIESSYLQNIENETQSPADTIQFILLNGEAWRIKTFAVDHDVHVYSLGPMKAEKFTEIAVANTNKHYGDVLSRQVIVETKKGFGGLRSELKSVGLPGFLEIQKSNDYAFWVPESNIYETKSKPE